MDKLKILLIKSCRSDEALTKPIIDKMSKDPFFDLYVMKVEPAEFEKNVGSIRENIRRTKVDAIYITGDRIEQHAGACAGFYENIKIIHYGSGITNTIATYDDISRHNIALMADLCLCEDHKSAFTTFNLRQTIGKIDPNYCNFGCRHDENNIHVVENLYLEGLETIDESLVPKEPYDLVLLNPETLSKKEFDFISQERLTIRIGSNPDGDVYDGWKKRQCLCFVDLDNVPRPQFLGLMKHCERFITNSSSAYYEAPAFLKPEQIVIVGERNKNRSTPTEWNQDYKSSDRIVEIIKVWWLKNER